MIPNPMNHADLFDARSIQSIATPGEETTIATIVTPADLDQAFPQGGNLLLTVTARKSTSRTGGYNLTYRLSGQVIPNLAAKLILHHATLR